MIKLLRISNIALVSTAELELGPGLTLLTGETGAGKSILIDALGLVLGARASADLIRTGADRAVVEAVVESDRARDALEGMGLPADEDEIIVRRELHASGKGRATVNGALVPANVLRDLGPSLAVIHGQHEPQGLLDPDTHLDVVDHHAHVDRAAVAEAYGRLRSVETQLDALRRDRREAERRREMLEYQLGEIDKAALRAGEEEDLRAEKSVQANAGRLASLSAEAYALLYEDDASALAHLRQVYRRVEELSGIDRRFQGHLEGREAVMAQLEELALFLRDYQDGVQLIPGRLDEIEARLAAIERLQRKYGSTEQEILAFAEQCRAELQRLLSPEETVRALETERAAAAARYAELALALSKKRRAAARDLEKKVEAELAQLAMEKTRFKVRFDPDIPMADGADTSGWTERGLESAEFLLSPNPGEELRPLARIASGGELSRILLALKSVATLDAPGQTLVFDEVDAGIGGRVAEVVGRKLRAISRARQVLCVTHLPQIASMADAHYVVRKSTERGRTTTVLERLGDGERVEEVARMLGGETVSDTARKHAKEMVRQAVRA
jgi:DNA repair protein RecN (Recombination protein N)